MKNIIIFNKNKEIWGERERKELKRENISFAVFKINNKALG
jgi:hypothetical protein